MGCEEWVGGVCLSDRKGEAVVAKMGLRMIGRAKVQSVGL